MSIDWWGHDPETINIIENVILFNSLKGLHNDKIK